MIWHIVRFDMSDVDPATRTELETDLAGLAALAPVAWLRVEHDLDDEGVTGLVTGFATRRDLEAYRVHPDHVPIVERVRGLGIPLVRLDLQTDDDVADLPT